ncbi:MAG: peroxiredoxin family protein, partial [Acidimicrobiia bacterium]|nr:peroxiredoxin family protein [Acidimicrobiia bacterium]
MLVDTLDVTPARFHADTGWEIKPEGACRGDVCVPLPDGFSLTGAAERLGMALVEEPAHGLWAVGPESVTGRALVSAEAPELELADLDGRTWRLSSLRGQKVVLV